MNKSVKKIKNLNQLKLIPLNNPLPFDTIISNFPTLIINYSSPNILQLFKNFKIFFENNSKLGNFENLKENLEENLKILFLIPHKIKNYEEYLVNNFQFPVYQTTDIFELELKPNEVITNVNNSLELKKSDSYYEIAYIYINKENIDFSLQIETEPLNSEDLKYIEKIKKSFPINFSPIIRDFKIIQFRKSFLLSILKNFENKSILNLNLLNEKLETENLLTLNIDPFIKSFDILAIDHNNVIITLLTFDNSIVFQNYSAQKDKIEIKKEIKLEELNPKLKSLDLKKVRITQNKFIIWDYNTIHIFDLKLRKDNVYLFYEITFINTSGQKTKHPPKPVDGIWKQTIWGNINNIFIENDFLFVADSEYNCLRKLNTNTGKSESIFLKESKKGYENIKGRISSISKNDFYTFFIDIDFKRIRRIDSNFTVYTVFFDEGINLYSQLYFLDTQNSIVYNSDKGVIFLNLYTQEVKIFEI